MKKLLRKILYKNNKIRRTKEKIFYKNAFRYDKNHYIKWSSSNRETKEQLEYDALLLSHALEKGMSFDKKRPFGSEKVNELDGIMKRLCAFKGEKESTAYQIVISTLKKYIDIYKENDWTNNPEYGRAKSIVDANTDVDEIEAGVCTINAKTIAGYDYESFLKGRHSVRDYQNKDLKEEDIKKAIGIARLSPSACNRQMIKVYNCASKKADTEVKKTINRNLSGFNKDAANALVVTYDQSAFSGVNERGQGFLNAGLFAMNFVNALHSIGIGSCMCEFNQSYKTEIKLKKALLIPDSERIAVVIMAGYYLKENKVFKSPRKNILDLYRKR